MSTGFFKNAKTTSSGNDVYTYMSAAANIRAFNYTLTTVADTEEFRPDKIALRCLGDERLDWVIDEANGFAHGAKEYTRATQLRIPLRTELQKAGIL